MNEILFKIQINNQVWIEGAIDNDTRKMRVNLINIRNASNLFLKII
jgi:hypothetical protein